MKTQIAKDSHQAAKRYSSVYQQQGRAVLDSDVNELSDIVKTRLDDALDDAIKSGAPASGGLAINNDFTIAPGRLYVDGIPAEVISETPVDFIAQTDLINPQALPANDFQLYADVWERSVTSLEDAALLDPGLHGADTCTRTQTMCQVKWGAASLDVMDETQNPGIGDAELSLALRTIFVSEDICDPCSIKVELDERIGNYLFRVEVHDVYNDGGEDFIILKWSRDNGAEQFVTGEEPAGFTSGDFVYEFFDEETEKNLGNHFMGVRAKRGILSDSYTVPVAPDEAKDYVRQWDGFCTINLSTTALVSGIDRGTSFSDAVNSDAHGYFEISTELNVNLELLQLTLTLNGNRFVAGDFWFTAVREAVNEPGDYVLGSEVQGELPNGVKHHYLVLATVDGAGVLVPQTDAQHRQFHFPALTNIMASDVGFIEDCNNLFHGAENVQEALDALCDIGAEDIAYVTPNCTTDTVLAYFSTLPGWPDLDNDGKASVKDMLDALFCNLNASTLPYLIPDCGTAADPSVRSLLGLPGNDIQPLDVSINALLCNLNANSLPYLVPGCDAGVTLRSLLGLTATNRPLKETLDTLLCDLRADTIPMNQDGSLCPDLQAAVTVQQALQILCEREVQAGGGCAISVDGSERTLDDELADFQGDAGRASIWLCLHAFEHLVTNPVALSNKDTVKIIGSGNQASTVRFTDEVWDIAAREVIFRDITFVLDSGNAGMRLNADNIVIENCQFIRGGNNPDAPPVIEAASAGNSANLVWNGNVLNATYSRLISDVDINDFTTGDIAANDSIVTRMNDLLGGQYSKYSPEYDQALLQLAQDIDTLPQDTKENWAAAIPQESIARIDRDGRNSTVIIRDSSRASLLANVSSDISGDFVTRTSSDTVRLADNFSVVTAGAREENINNFYQSLADAAITVDQRVTLLDDFVTFATESGFTHGLGLADNNQTVNISDSTFNAHLVLNTALLANGRELTDEDISLGGNFLTAQNQLLVSKSRIYRVVTFIGLDAAGGPALPLTGYARCMLSDNEFTGMDESVLGGIVQLNNNFFSSRNPTGRYMEILGVRVMITQNITLEPDATIHFRARDGAITSDNMGTVFS
ncbi:DUF6519 domain-containing protein [Thalassomonas actiniarum]|uniref:Right handed beta helix domain-containing protein n=1 Tax=Thalassomonas actiniarum TaxID=485447 RepID=A0AAE9YUZ1_9GAMM|nr:DUF6519 domain-containing protein [Thalassomonas actiniarum]WDE00800.1 hypothetical protein SG35_009290 [Thalassomonas actiniarum]